LAPAEGHGQQGKHQNGHNDDHDYCYSRHRLSATPPARLKPCPSIAEARVSP
jgi:hypothetical protein